MNVYLLALKIDVAPLEGGNLADAKTHVQRQKSGRPNRGRPESSQLVHQVIAVRKRKRVGVGLRARGGPHGLHGVHVNVAVAHGVFASEVQEYVRLALR